MDPIAYKVAERIINKEEIRKRIEAIPGWQRSNFLMSLYRQVERSPLSEKQVAVLDKIEREQKGHTPGGHADIQLNPRKQWLETSEIKSIIYKFVEKPIVTVYDPRGLIAPNTKLHEYMVRELASGFWGQAEMYAENNADEDDPTRRRVNDDMRSRNEGAGREMEHAKLHVKQDGPQTILTITPSFQDVLHRHKLTR